MLQTHDLVKRAITGEELAGRPSVDLHRDDPRRAVEARWDRRIGMGSAGRSFGGDPSPSQPSGDKERQGRLKRALDSLPLKDRNVLVMRHMERLGVDKIASVLEISEGAVKARLVRALIRLQRLIDSEA